MTRADAIRGNLETRGAFGGENGIALIGVLLLLSALLVLGVFTVRGANVELKIAGNDMADQKALNLAEAGLHHAVALINVGNGQFDDELASSGAGGDLVAMGSTATLNGKLYRFRNVGTAASDGYYVRIDDNFDELSGSNDPTSDVDRTVKISSIGRVRGAERVVEAMARATGGGFGGFYGRDKVTTSGGAKVDSFDSTQGPYNPLTATLQAKVVSNGDVTMTNSSGYVRGDVSAGGTVSIDGTVTGTTTQGAAPVNFDSVTPCGPPFSSGAGITGAGVSYDSSTGKLSSSGGSPVTFANGTYCLGEISFSGGSNIVVNGAVEIYLTGKVAMSGGGLVNTTKSPSNLKFFSSSTNDFVLTGGSDAYAIVYAPDAKVNYTGGADFFGSIIGRELINTGGGTLHADSSLNAGGPVTVFNMRESRNF